MSKLLYYGQPINRKEPLNTGLVSRWQVVPWYASGPRWIDLAGRNHGTLTNGPTWDGARGRQGGYGSIKFDGTDDYIDTGKSWSNYLTASTGTISVWCRPTGTSPVVANSWLGRAIISDSSGAGGANIHITQGTIAGTDAIWMQNYDGTEDRIGVPYTSNEWIHLILVHGGGVLYAYKNGALVSSVASGNTTVISTGTVVIGKRFVITGYYFQGFVDDVRIFSRALSASEVKALYDDSRAGSTQTLNWIHDVRRMPQLGGLLTQHQWCAGLDRHWVGGLM